jgi:hypothetical protein
MGIPTLIVGAAAFLAAFALLRPRTRPPNSPEGSPRNYDQAGGNLPYFKPTWRNVR